MSRKCVGNVYLSFRFPTIRKYYFSPSVTLPALLAKACSLETSEAQTAGMETSSSLAVRVNQVRKDSRRQPLPTRNTLCRNCGLLWPHTTSPCRHVEMWEVKPFFQSMPQQEDHAPSQGWWSPQTKTTLTVEITPPSRNNRIASVNRITSATKRRQQHWRWVLVYNGE